MMMNQSQVMNPVHVMHQIVMNQLPQVHIWNQIHPSNQMLNQSQFMMNLSQVPPHMMNRSNAIWPIESMKFSNNVNRENYPVQNWIDRRRETVTGRLGRDGSYRAPNQNHVKSGRFYQKKKLMKKKKNNNKRSVLAAAAPYAPRNTTSFLIRANRCGGIADLVSPYPVTPAILQTPQLISDMVKEELGVDGYGSMNGLIRRLKSPQHEDEVENNDGSSSSSDGDHIEMEKKLDYGLSRFEMIYPNYGRDYHNVVLENRVNDQDDHISELEKENMLLREKLNLMKNEMNDLKKILQKNEGNDDDDDDDDDLMNEKHC